MISHEPPVPRLVPIDRRQLLLRTVDVEKLVEDEHCVRSIWELVGRLDLRSELGTTELGTDGNWGHGNWGQERVKKLSWRMIRQCVDCGDDES